MPFNSGRKKYGALPSQTLRDMLHSGMICGASEKNVSPASLDLSLAGEAYHVHGVLQARRGERIADLAKKTAIAPHDLSKPLQRDSTYLIRLNESLALPPGVYGYCNPKSSTGRLDMHVRVLVDGNPRYDSVPEGYRGDLWVSVTPRSFSIRAREGETLTQLRLFTGDTRMNELELMIAMKEYQLLWQPGNNTPMSYEEMPVHDGDGGMVLSVGLEGRVCGYRSKETDATVDLSARSLDPKEFFEPLAASGDTVTLEKDRFYILTTAERVRIPPSLASEMVPMDERSGDFRSHYAGFLDPGWGWGMMGEGFGRPFTLEVRPFENIIVRQGQPIAKIRFELVTDEPDVTYDTKESNYTKQSGPRLGKQFALA